jgi:hypothetical protein
MAIVAAARREKWGAPRYWLMNHAKDPARAGRKAA